MESPKGIDSQSAINKPKDYFKDIESVLSAHLPDDIDDAMDEISKLPEEKKKEFLEMINSKPDSITELKDNIPLSVSKINQIMDIYKKQEVTKTKQEVTETNQNVAETNQNVAETNQNVAETNQNVAETNENEAIQNKLYKESVRLKNEIVGESGIKLPVEQTEKAKTELLKSNPELTLNPEKLEQLSQMVVLRQNKEQLIQSNPQLLEKFTKFEQVSGGLKEFNNLKIDTAFPPKSLILKRNTDLAKELLSGEGAEVKINGTKITGGKSGITVDVSNGKVLQEGNNGYQIGLDKSNIKIDYLAKAKIRELQNKIQTNEQKIDGNSRLLSSLPQSPNFDKNNIPNLLNNPNTSDTTKIKLSSLQDAQNDLEQNKQSLSFLKEKGEDTSLLETIIKEQEKDIENKQKEIQQSFVDMYNQTNTLISDTKALHSDLRDLLKQNDEQNLRNTISTQESQETARDTLNFLDTLGLTNIHQKDLEQIISRVNREQNVFGLTRQVDLETGFKSTGSDVNQIKREFVNMLLPIYEKMGIDVNVESLVAGRKNPQITDKKNFDEKLSKVGIVQKKLHIETFMSALKPKNEK